MYTTVYNTDKQGLLHSIGNYIQYSVITYKEKNLKLYMYVCIHHWITALYIWNIVNPLYFNKNKLKCCHYSTKVATDNM